MIDPLRVLKGPKEKDRKKSPQCPKSSQRERGGEKETKKEIKEKETKRKIL